MKPTLRFNKKVLDVKDDVFEKIENLHKEAASLRDLLVEKKSLCDLLIEQNPLRENRRFTVLVKSNKVWGGKNIFTHTHSIYTPSRAIKENLSAHEKMQATKIIKTLDIDIEQSILVLKTCHESIVQSLFPQNPDENTYKVSLAITITHEIHAAAAWHGNGLPSRHDEMNWRFCLDKERADFLNSCLCLRQCALQHPKEKPWHVKATTSHEEGCFHYNDWECWISAKTKQDAFAKACQIDGNLISPGRVFNLDIAEKCK